MEGTQDQLGIPEEKLIEQRHRYLASRKGRSVGLYTKATMAMMGMGAMGMGFGLDFEEERGPDGWPKPQIIEADAGQRELDELEKREKEAQFEIELQAHEEERKAILPFVDEIGRNAACPCGSGKKYKKCHLHDMEVRISKWYKEHQRFRHRYKKDS